MRKGSRSLIKSLSQFSTGFTFGDRGKYRPTSLDHLCSAPGVGNWRTPDGVSYARFYLPALVGYRVTSTGLSDPPICCRYALVVNFGDYGDGETLYDDLLHGRRLVVNLICCAGGLNDAGMRHDRLLVPIFNAHSTTVIRARIGLDPLISAVLWS